MRWAGHVAQMEMRNAYTILTLKGRDLSEDLGVDGGIVLEGILKEIGWGKV
jgi:hypothetical protein